MGLCALATPVYVALVSKLASRGGLELERIYLAKVMSAS